MVVQTLLERGANVHAQGGRTSNTLLLKQEVEINREQAHKIRVLRLEDMYFVMEGVGAY
ncbi:hypothetical protein Asppvi_007097 [Aspergillus pseudoviridinutans]|uniref:Uncharacterized protein n=1 Tax=Aspergillus pseudoviridinutans TaxID=1517512 RepID=A0A9P3EU77_9EURO|nr:uncharacterized protein Asppvi_007097 [Aspergillus pseudoviridinutans]GIJ88179.1 hypothetical protein Asppvi_007097 [Aspergillus pseudoviridinutans]